ncbi:MAG: lycopene cyclase family protein [Bacteroidota bacterium]
MSTKPFDYAIIGAGAAGLQLVFKMVSDPFFEEKTIIILEKEEKNANDKTWSFWEKETSEWDALAIRSWKEGLFISDQQVELSFEPYQYKTVRAADFYAYTTSRIKKHKGVTWVDEEVIRVNPSSIQTAQAHYKADQIFDSRIAPRFKKTIRKYDALIQHFKGWVIETATDVFNPEVFTMMDYRLQWKDHTSFTYVLPFSSTKALVEFTLFDQQMLADEEYDEMLRKYVEDFLQLKEYKVLEIEKGQIPMTVYPFHRDHSSHVTKIGTAGGWVRPSSGYSFKNADRNTTKIIQNLKKGRKAHKGIHNRKHHLFDRVFLNVLVRVNKIGVEVFSTFYTKHPVPRLLRFLDSESALSEDVKIIFSLNRKEFRRALVALFKFW